MLSVPQISKLYSTELYSYDHDPKRTAGTLVCSGTGLMLGIMDQTRLLHCVDFDTAKNDPMCRIESFMRLVAHYDPPLVVAGWFTSTRPERLQAGLRAIDELDRNDKAVLAYSGAGIVELWPWQYTELDALFCAVERWPW